MSDKLGSLSYDLTINEQKLNKEIESIDAKLKSASTRWEKQLSLSTKSTAASANKISSDLQKQFQGQFTESIKSLTTKNDQLKIMADQYGRLEKESQKASLAEQKRIQRDISANEKLAKSQAKRVSKSFQGQFTESIRSLTTQSDELKKMSNYYKQLEKDTNAYYNNLSKETKEAANAEKKHAQALERAAIKAEKLAEKKHKETLAHRKNERVLKTSNTEYKKQGLYLQNLRTLAASYASIFAVARIADKIREVTGEFELQNKALAAILQNKEKADQLFGQVTDLALKSPFAIKELLTYTKQLAAYRIETESLIPTLTQLADVSAGLGVDMSRLILAYGQVKAASVLRGTELRQFTEAGIPLVQLLADKFSILEGRVVSTNEVFDKISNRMVSFAMVSEVFEDMTSEGGTFFEAQAVQAKTLAGMWNILGDAIDKAMFAIGTENMDVLKGAVQGATDLTRSWEGIARALGIAVKSFGVGVVAQRLFLGATGKTIVSLYRQSIAFEKSTFAQKRATAEMLRGNIAANKTIKGLKALKGALGGIAFGAVAGLGFALYDTYVEAGRLNKELNELSSSELVRGKKLADGFKDMARAVTEAADGSKDQRDALVDLNRVYKDYIPNQSLTIDNLKVMGDNYDSVTEAIDRKIEAQAREKAADVINKEFTEKSEKASGKFIDALINTGKLTKEQAVIFAGNFGDSFKKALESGDEFEFGKELRDNLSSFLETDLVDEWGTSVLRNYTDVTESAREFLIAFRDHNAELEKSKDSYDALFPKNKGRYTSEINNLKELSSAYENTIKKIDATGDLTNEEAETKKLEAQKNRILATIKLYEDLAKEKAESEDDNYSLLKIQAAKNELKGLVKEQDNYVESVRRAIKEAGVGGAFIVTEQEADDTSKHQARIAKAYEESANEIAIAKEKVKRLKSIGVVLDEDSSEVKDLQRRIKERELLNKLLFDSLRIEDKDGISDAEKARLNNLKAQVKLLTDIKKAREDLSKTLSGDKVNESIEKLFRGQADDLGIEIPISSDSSAFVVQLKKLAVEGEKLGEKVGGAFVKGTRSKIAKLQVDDIVTSAKDALKALDLEIKKSKGKYDFYKDVLGITGDEGIALKFGIDKRQFTEVLKESTEKFAKLRGFDLTFDELKDGFDKLPPEIQKRVASVDKSIEESTKNSILDKLKFLEQSIPEGLGLEFDFSNVISDLDKKVKELKREVAKAVVSADTGEIGKIKELEALKLKAINEEARQRAEKIGGAYIKEQLEIKQLGQAYSNMTDASLKDIDKILAALKQSKDDLLSGDGIAAILDRASVSGESKAGFFSGLADTKNIDQFLLKLDEINSEISNIDELSIGDATVSEEELGRLRAVVETLQAMGVAVQNASETTDRFKTDKQITEWKKLGSEMLGVIDIMSGVGDAFGDDLSESGKRAIAGIKGVVGAVTSSITIATNAAGKALSALEKASVILTIVSTAMQLAQGIQNIIGSAEDRENERLAAASKLAADRLEIENKINDRYRDREELQSKNILLNQNFAKDMTDAFEDFYVETDKFNEALNALETGGIFTGTGSASNVWGKKTKEINVGIADLVKGLEGGTSSFRKALNTLSNALGLDFFGFGRGSRASKRAIKDLENTFNETLNIMGKNASDVANFTNDEWLLFYQTMNDLGAITDEGTKKFLEMAEAAQQAAIDAQEAMDGFITDLAGGLENDLATALRNGFEQGIDAAEAFKNSVEDIMEELVLQGIINTLFDDAFADLASNIKESFDPESGKADKSIVDDLAKFYDATGGLYEDAINAIDEAKKDAESRGFDLFGGTEELGSLAKGIQGVNEDTARRLEALLNSIREVSIGDSGKMTEIVSSINNQSVIASQSIAHLQTISNNTMGIKSALESVLTNAQSTGGTGIKVYVQ